MIVPLDGETNSQHIAQLNKNTDRTRRRMVEGATAAAAAAGSGAAIGGGDANQQGGRRIIHNLANEFHQVDRHEVEPTPSTNLIVAKNGLGRLLPTPELTMDTTMLKVVAV